jgi:hypothetical protein
MEFEKNWRLYVHQLVFLLNNEPKREKKLQEIEMKEIQNPEHVFQPSNLNKMSSSLFASIIAGGLVYLLVNLNLILYSWLAGIVFLIPLGQFRNRLIISQHEIIIRRVVGEKSYLWTEIIEWKRLHQTGSPIIIWFKTRDNKQIALDSNAFGFDEKKVRKLFGKYFIKGR